MENRQLDHDSRWKEIISNLFEDFVQFFLPQAYSLIDFQSNIEFLEQELLKLFSDKYREGKIVNDKLVKVRLLSGEEKWILIHIEIQSSHETDFSERMFTYFYRIYDKYNQKITAIAIYTGDKTPKKYNKFDYDFLGTKLNYEFNSYKVRSIEEQELLKSENPFALVVLASKYLIQSQKDESKKLSFKLKLIRLCKERKYTDNQIVNLLRFIDLILILPKEQELLFEEEVISKYIKSANMSPTESQIRFANKIHLALYGETIEEKAKREEREKATFEKTLIIQKIMKESDWSNEKISNLFEIPIDIVIKIRDGVIGN